MPKKSLGHSSKPRSDACHTSPSTTIVRAQWPVAQTLAMRRLVAARDHAAVDDEFSAGHEARFVRGEKERRISRVEAVAHETNRNALLPLSQERLDIAASALLGETRPAHGRVQLTGNDRVHADPLGGILHGDHARELDDACLGRGVADLSRTGPPQA